MASLKEVRNRINSVRSTQQITKAMKMVAAAKLRRSQEAIVRMRPYAQRLMTLLQDLSASLGDSVENPFANKREVKNVLVVVISSDRGLAGAFNSNAFKGTLQLIREKYATQSATGNITIMPIGKKANEFFIRRNYKTISQFAELFSLLSFEAVRSAAELAMEGFLSSKYDAVEIVYNEFKNVATQVVRQRQFLPIVPTERATNQTRETGYIFEPSQEDIFKELVPKSLKVQFYEYMLESNAAEHGARMTAMDKATENAGDLLKQLRLTYNQTRQAAITKEILEIVGGAEALAAS
ncbi:MAG: ATP synthase F1 subunit gamma [Verrucomicrobia bacterium]|nr:ATP synthase F1 subunit gamma [Cytophagales bacterium]